MVCSLTLCFRATSGTGALSASRRIATICSSLKRLFFMGSLSETEAILRSYDWVKEPGQVTARVDLVAARRGHIQRPAKALGPCARCVVLVVRAVVARNRGAGRPGTRGAARSVVRDDRRGRLAVGVVVLVVHPQVARDRRARGPRAGDTEPRITVIDHDCRRRNAIGNVALVVRPFEARHRRAGWPGAYRAEGGAAVIDDDLALGLGANRNGRSNDECEHERPGIPSCSSACAAHRRSPPLRRVLERAALMLRASVRDRVSPGRAYAHTTRSGEPGQPSLCVAMKDRFSVSP